MEGIEEEIGGALEVEARKGEKEAMGKDGVVGVVGEDIGERLLFGGSVGLVLSGVSAPLI